ncbi:hypothetical protein TOC8172_50540 [Pseudomonas syringae]
MKLKDICSKTKFIALASFAVLSLQMPLVHADGGAQLSGAQGQGSAALNSGSGQGGYSAERLSIRFPRLIDLLYAYRLYHAMPITKQAFAQEGSFGC